jgi:hypothetical protein
MRLCSEMRGMASLHLHVRTKDVDALQEWLKRCVINRTVRSTRHVVLYSWMASSVRYSAADHCSKVAIGVLPQRLKRTFIKPINVVARRSFCSREAVAEFPATSSYMARCNIGCSELRTPGIQPIRARLSLLPNQDRWKYSSSPRPL